MLHILIFSKDRACQLESLLSSLDDHCLVPVKKTTILYQASDIPFTEGYALLQSLPRRLECTWIKETVFDTNVRGIIAGLTDNAKIMFLVDDDIFFRPFADTALINALSSEHLFASLRCSRDYPQDVQPVFIKANGYLEWAWNYNKRHWVTWNYPFSVDGHIYNGKVIKKVVQRIRFKAPNSFEGEMHRYRHHWWVKRIKRGLATAEACVVNNPLNKVQNESDTWNQEISVQTLNQKFLDGYRIDNKNFYQTKPTATHCAMPLSFIKKP